MKTPTATQSLATNVVGHPRNPLFVATNIVLCHQCDALFTSHHMLEIKTWYENASITFKARYDLTKDLSTDKDPLWPAEMICLDEAVLNSLPAAIRKQLEIRSAMAYLRVTDFIEPYHVDPVCARLAAGEDGLSGLYIPTNLRVLAAQVRTDEAMHRTVSSDLIDQTGIKAKFTPDYATKLELYLALHFADDQERMVALILFACVTETVITKFLSYAVKPDVIYAAGLKDSIKAHAFDEARHHQIFKRVMKLLFLQLEEKSKIRFACAIPDFICIFLSPDLTAARFALEILMAPHEIEAHLRKRFTRPKVLASIREDAKAVIALVKEMGLLEYPEVRAAFRRAGLGKSII